AGLGQDRPAGCSQAARGQRHPRFPERRTVHRGEELRRRALGRSDRLTTAGSPAVTTNVGRPFLGGRRFSLDWVGAVPFFVYVVIFLMLPSGIVDRGLLRRQQRLHPGELRPPESLVRV